MCCAITRYKNARSGLRRTIESFATRNKMN